MEDFGDYATYEDHEDAANDPNLSTAEECCFAWRDDKQCQYVFLATTDASGVNYRDLKPEQRKVFDAARKLERNQATGNHKCMDFNAYQPAHGNLVQTMRAQMVDFTENL